MSEKTATIIGATGMIGTYLTSLLLEDDHFDFVRLIVRRPVPKTHPKMEVKLVDFNDAESLKLSLEGTDCLFCCIGTTQKNVKGDKDLYRRIDLDIPVTMARFAKEAGCEQFLLISSMGANSKSGTFYLQLKGEVENAIRGIGFESVDVLRPSMLLGKRNESRPREKFLQNLMKTLSFLLPKNYKAIEGKVVARAMLELSKQKAPGFHIHENGELLGYAG